MLFPTVKTLAFIDLAISAAFEPVCKIKCVFVIFRILEHEPHPAVNKLLNKPLCNLFFPLIQFFYREKSFLAENFDEGVEEGSCFQVASLLSNQFLS